MPGGEHRPVIPYAELEDFFLRLVASAQARGITCAITSGMACVHFGIAATTKDCHVLCDAAKSDDFRKLLVSTELRGGDVFTFSTQAHFAQLLPSMFRPKR